MRNSLEKERYWCQSYSEGAKGMRERANKSDGHMDRQTQTHIEAKNSTIKGDGH